MALKGSRAKWLAVPLAALFLLFSTGAAAAPECHVTSTVQSTGQSEQVHSHSGHPHSHSHQTTTSVASNLPVMLLSLGSTLSSETCVVVGFIVLLLLRFSRPIRSTLTAKRFSLPRYQLPLFLSKNLSYLNLNHLQLGIIRI